MNKQYVAQTDEGYRIAGTRVSLDSIVYAFFSGQTAESIAQSFPVLSLEQVYGAITYYLANQDAIDTHLAKSEAQFEEMRQKSRDSDPMFYLKFSKARQHERAVGQ